MTDTPADQLREAAEKLRACATAAHPGPWDSMPHLHIEDGCRCLSCLEASGWLLTHTATCDETELASRNKEAARCSVDVLSFEDAEYVIAAHPGVGIAVADWLDAYAEHLAASTHPSWQETVSQQPLAVARAILGADRTKGAW